jgi:hypothetical protein
MGAVSGFVSSQDWGKHFWIIHILFEWPTSSGGAGVARDDAIQLAVGRSVEAGKLGCDGAGWRSMLSPIRLLFFSLPSLT